MVVLSVKGRKFLGCSRYPECKSTKSISTGVHCPQPGCEGTIVERKTRRGKTFYGCSAYPKCTFATWDRPVDTKCTSCGFPLMVYKENQRKGAFLSCPSCRAEAALPEQPAKQETPAA
jgi:DNA topoisomerase-1